MSSVSFSDFILRWQDAEYALLLQKRGAVARLWDSALAKGSIDLNAATELKAALVSAGILTSARAEIILPKPPPPAMTPTWARRAASLLTLGATGKWDDNTVYEPCPVRNLDRGLYRDAKGKCYVYYIGWSPTFEGDQTGLFKTTDFVTSERVSVDAPILACGVPGDPDYGDVQVGTVIHDGTTFHMWYTANANRSSMGDGGDYCTVCYATSTNGTQFTKHGRVMSIYSGSDGNADLYDPLVCIGHDGLPKMLVTGHRTDGTLGALAYTAPALSGPWEAVRNAFISTIPFNIFLSDFWYEQGQYHALYLDCTDNQNWYARSPDYMTLGRQFPLSASGPLTWEDASPYSFQAVSLSQDRRLLMLNSARIIGCWSGVPD